MSSIPPHTCVYAIRATQSQMVKIGVTGNINERIRYIQNGASSPLRLVIAIESLFAWEIEEMLHTALATGRVSGEWFDIPSDALVRKMIIGAVEAVERKGKELGIVPAARAQVKNVSTVLERLDKGADRDQAILDLARQRDGDHWRYSANKIFETVGGDRNAVLAAVKAERATPQYRPLTEDKKTATA